MGRMKDLFIRRQEVLDEYRWGLTSLTEAIRELTELGMSEDKAEEFLVGPSEPE